MATAAQIAQWITRIGTIAKEQAKRHYQLFGRTIFPSVCIAQSCIESAWGTAPKMINANAVFGIKVGSGKKWGGAWNGKSYKTGTVEYYDGKNATRISDSFRAYDTIEQSVEDYYDLLTKSERYKYAWDVRTPRACIEGIQKAPYATDPGYVNKVMSIIEKYGLTVYDNDILKSSAPIAQPVEVKVSQTVMIGHASIDERGKIASGQAGDQTKKEVCTRSWYKKNWSVLLRPKNASLAELSAQACEKACSNDNIGYDQNQRNSCYTQAKKVGYDISRINTPCETDCSALMTLCAIAGGARSLEYSDNAPTTRTMVNAFVLTGLYDKFTDSKYLTSPDYLRRGDILVQPGSHTVMVLTNGPKADTFSAQQPIVQKPTYASKQKLEYTSDGKLILETLPSGVHVVSEVNGIYKLGDKGPEVKLIQSKLQSLGYRVDVDGYYDVMTATALKQFQTAKHLEADGECGPQTAFALQI